MDDRTLAMLGDKAAQERITERGELLPCPCCAGKADCWEDTGNWKGFAQCLDCELMIQSTSKEAARAEWNHRAPILTETQIALLKIAQEPRKFREGNTHDT